MKRLREALAGHREAFRSVTGATFWATLGSLATLWAAAPETALTRQILPLELGLLIGMALGYLSFRNGEEPWTG
ncbi:MAG: hypothetical protein V1924_02540 [Candidatus Bathyarchaeota archaeon]